MIYELEHMNTKAPLYRFCFQYCFQWHITEEDVRRSIYTVTWLTLYVRQTHSKSALSFIITKPPEDHQVQEESRKKICVLCSVLYAHTLGTETTVKNVHTAGVFGGNVTACKTGSVTRTELKVLEENRWLDCGGRSSGWSKHIFAVNSATRKVAKSLRKDRDACAETKAWQVRVHGAHL